MLLKGNLSKGPIKYCTCTLAMGREFVKLKINIANADFKDRLFIGSVSLKKDIQYMKPRIYCGQESRKNSE